MQHIIDKPEDLQKDLASTYRSSDAAAPRAHLVDDKEYAILMEKGYLVLPDLLSAEKVAQIRDVAQRLLSKQGRNNFEGLKTQRAYNVLTSTTILDDLITHPKILALIDRIHQPNYLLSQAQLINILPDEDAQLLHFDDGFYQIPRPRPALGCAAIWAIDDFTKENGATRLIPGSHRFAEDEYGDENDTVVAEMKSGSAVFFLGTTVHGGGANNTDRNRLAVACQYCEPYLRQQENFLLEISRERAKAMSKELVSMIGYSITPPFMGMVDGQHPIRLLSEKE